MTHDETHKTAHSRTHKAAEGSSTPDPHRLLNLAHGIYKRVLSPVLHAAGPVAGACPYQPTCSEYAVLALAQHGALRGGALAFWRLLRCNPLSRGGWDPVPAPRRSSSAV